MVVRGRSVIFFSIFCFLKFFNIIFIVCFSCLKGLFSLPLLIGTFNVFIYLYLLIDVFFCEELFKNATRRHYKNLIFTVTDFVQVLTSVSWL